MSLIVLLKDQHSQIRSLAKALTWRVTATLTTALIAYIVSGEVKTAVIKSRCSTRSIRTR